MFMVNLQFVNLQFVPEFPLSNFQIPSLLLVHAEAVFIHKEYSDKLRDCLSGFPSTVLLKNSRFVSGHRFSDAASCSKSDWLLAQSVSAIEFSLAVDSLIQDLNLIARSRTNGSLTSCAG